MDISEILKLAQIPLLMVGLKLVILGQLINKVKSLLSIDKR